jgi:mono/diheme cytochrome c family protein
MISAHAVSTLGDLYEDDSSYAAVVGTNSIIALLDREEAICKYHAAIALGKTGVANDIPALLDLLDRNNNEDVAIRHAASYGLSLIGDANAIAAEAKPKGPAARLGAVLALRRLDSPLLANFLVDEDEVVAAEAARAIYDKRVMDAMPALAALSDTILLKRMSEPVMRRVIEANVRLADQASAMRLAKLAENTTSPEAWRLLALTELDGWASERNREGVWGAWWPRPEQTMDQAKAAMMIHLPAVAGDKNNKIATQARTLMQKHIKQSSPAELAQSALNPDEPEALRIGSLTMLADADQTLAAETAKQLTEDQDVSADLRIQARLALIGLDLEAGQQAYAQALDSGELAEQQDAIERLGLGPANSAIAGETFVKLTEALKRGELDPALQLDVIEAVTKNKTMPTPVRLAVQQHVEQSLLPAEAPFIRSASIAGGSAARGLNVFVQQCAQCHQADVEATQQGPNLNGIALVHDMDYLYTSVVLPNADILAGYVNEAGQSNMKPMNDVLSPMELRDVLAYLASLKSDPGPAYRKVKTAGLNAAGPQIVQSASKWNHALLLPVTLLLIGVSLLALLVLTVIFGRMPKL